MSASKTSRYPVTSVFVPPFGLQGQKLSCHVLWDHEAQLQNLEIQCDDGLSCLHAYNVPEKGVIIAEGGADVKFLQANENGYVGFVLQSRHLKVPEASLKVRIRGLFRQDTQQFSFEDTLPVLLFRPDLTVFEGPGSIEVEFPREQASPKVTPRIRLSNRGRGSALVAITWSGGKSSKVVNYFEDKSERERYIKVLTERLSALKLDYPRHTNFIDRIVELLNKVSSPDSLADEQTLHDFEDFKMEAQKIEKEEMDLIEDIAAAFGDALLATFSLDLRFIAWTQSLQASREQRIFLLNPWAAIPIAAGKTPLTLELRYADFTGHEYPRIALPKINLESNAPGLLPVFELFNVVPPVGREVPGVR